MLDSALEETVTVLRRLQGKVGLKAKAGLELATARNASAALPQSARDGNSLSITTRQYHLTLDASNGGRVAGLARVQDGNNLLVGPSHAVVLYAELGGLWRMGCEFRGGRFREANLSIPPVEFSTSEQDGYLRVDWQTCLPGSTLAQTLWMGNDDPLIYFQVEGRAVEKTTLVARYSLPFRAGELLMEAPGGPGRRPRTRSCMPAPSGRCSGSCISPTRRAGQASRCCCASPEPRRWAKMDGWS